MNNNLLCYTVVLCLLAPFSAISARAEDGTDNSLEQLQVKLAKQDELITKLRAEFHRLKYVVIPHAYSKSIVDVEKIVGAIGANAADMEQEILPKLQHQETAPSTTTAEHQSMTAAELALWLNNTTAGNPGNKCTAIIEMLPYVSDLTPLTLRRLAYTPTTSYCWAKEIQSVIDVGTKPWQKETKANN